VPGGGIVLDADLCIPAQARLAVVEAANAAGLARKVARVEPLVCIRG
jgi:hypothetical protein